MPADLSLSVGVDDLIKVFVTKVVRAEALVETIGSSDACLDEALTAVGASQNRKKKEVGCG